MTVPTGLECVPVLIEVLDLRAAHCVVEGATFLFSSIGDCRLSVEEYLVSERNLARNTQLSYRDTLALLLPFVAAQARTPVDRLGARDLDADRVRAFLVHLEQGRGCSPRTRNQRLAAIRCFARYVAGRCPEHVAWCSRIRAVPLKKAAPPPVGYLEKHEIEALLDAPNTSTPQGRLERALLLFLYHTGARASEAAQLRVGRLQLAGNGPGHSLVTLRGKGGKTRLCPLLPASARALAPVVQGRGAGEAVFLSRLRRPITRSGIRQQVGRCTARAVQQAPSLAGKKVGPHVLRCTAATHLLRSGVDLNTIRAWLGHVRLDTITVYAEIDLQRKAKSVTLFDSDELAPDQSYCDYEGPMSFLRSL